MYFLQTVVAPILAAALTAQAVPLSESSESNLNARQNLPAAPATSAPKPMVEGNVPTKVVCTGGAKTRSYVRADINSAVQRAQQYINAQTVGLAGNPPVVAQGYPHNFNNNENYAFPGCNGQLQEFPILDGGKTFRSQPTDTRNAILPGPDRVVFAAIDNAHTQFCGVITHDGADDNSGFNVCR